MEQNYKELRLCPGGAEATSTWKQTQPETFRYTFPIISDSPFHWLVLALEALWASQVALVVKNPPAKAGGVRDTGSILGQGRFPWRRAWQSTPVFLSGKSYGQRSLADCSLQGPTESDRTEATQHALTWKVYQGSISVESVHLTDLGSRMCRRRIEENEISLKLLCFKELRESYRAGTDVCVPPSQGSQIITFLFPG